MRSSNDLCYENVLEMNGLIFKLGIFKSVSRRPYQQVIMKQNQNSLIHLLLRRLCIFFPFQAWLLFLKISYHLIKILMPQSPRKVKHPRQPPFSNRKSSCLTGLSHSITLSSSKPVALHSFSTSQSAHNLPPQKQYLPQFWGCIVPQHLKQIQNQRLKRLVRAKSENRSRHQKQAHEHPQINEQGVSEMLLTYYLKRKQRSRNKSQYRLSSKASFKQSADLQAQSLHSHPSRTLTPPKRHSLTKPTLEQTHINEDRFESQINCLFQSHQSYTKSKQRQREMQGWGRSETAQRIGQLSEIIKWRSRLLHSIQVEMDKTKAIQMWRD